MGLIGAECTRLRTPESLVSALTCWLTLVSCSPTRTAPAECSFDCTLLRLSRLLSRFPWLEKAITLVLSPSFHGTETVLGHVNKRGSLTLGPALTPSLMLQIAGLLFRAAQQLKQPDMSALPKLQIKTFFH